ncbi:AsmA family protein [Novosphingobium guangzhouense]|uniref:AsmA family protein n=1 Tax=Novosphingobium guangzhouense TaxID=1850347 RepID=A0A2K2G6R4_9SPHN|nr:AsmA family protein [Novosphingobium guangzhouense]PNU06731.1 AsmA family protein [Novosphingobium guangzhouense]
MEAPAAIEAPAPEEHSGRSERRRWHIVRNVALIVLGSLFAVWLILFITKGRFLKHPFESVTSSLTDRKVSVGGDFQLYFAPLRIKFLAEKLEISNPQWAKGRALFAAGRIDARIAPLSLIFGRRHVYSLDLEDGVANLEWDAAHRRNTWTFTSDGEGKPFEMPRIDQATITGTRLRYIDPQMPLLANLLIEPVAAADTRIGKAVGLTGDGRFRDTPFRVSAQLLSPDASIAGGENRLRARAWAANNVIDVSGTLPALTEFEGVPLNVAAQGRNLSELLSIIDVAIPQTRRYALKAKLVKDADVYRFTGMTGTFGQSDLSGRFTITNAERLRMDAALETRRLDIIDAAPFIGYNPDTVAAKGAVAAAAETGAGGQRILPDAALPVEMMQRFDAGLKWKVGIVRSKNVPIANIALTLSLDKGRLELSPLTFSMARGDVASDLVFDTRQRPSANSFDIRLASTPMGRLLAGYGLADSGTTGTIHGRVKLDGRGDTIHDSLASSNGRIAFVMPQGTLWTRNAQLAELDLGTFVSKMFQGKLKKPIEVNCGLLAFTVRGGVAAADPILIDTSKNVVTGRGGFSFDSEAIDLAFRADGKKFSLFSGQSPVGLGGHFAEPSLQVISPQLLGRAGAGLGLAVIATPVAGLLAFVDPGDAKSAACGPVLSGARASAQRTSKGKPRDDLGSGKSGKID